VVEISGSADVDPLHWFARLCDVAPDGTVTLVTGAGRAGRPDAVRDRGSIPAAAAAAEASSPPGASSPPAVEPVTLPLELHVTSWVFPRGHRIRLSVSNAMWPMIWPTPHPATATVRLGPAGTRLVLPVIPAQARPQPAFGTPAADEHPPDASHRGEMLPVRWTMQRDDTGTTAVWWRGCTTTEFGWGRVTDEEYLRYEVNDDHPAGAAAHGAARTEIHLDGRLIVVTSVLDLDGDEESLRYRFRRELRENGLLTRERNWERRYPRDGH
jgi:uncharacterized protein